ncbi:tripartite tricarboxylate transporter TctB family protein [Alkalihalobacillus sp. BA299]|uniref:tripartite tricarboxylate transporter TctB family protein n=1 Tax=Alkalihalobacillus sp. BA299 TaxID=2815938 RepID=UPI001ADA97C2|nr:tripartite tricarboxylate transporter TctB family protein [Alkalihalobacillus sp. BA299]
MKKEIYVNITIICISLFMLYVINQIPHRPNTAGLGPDFFPKLIIYLIIFFNALQMIILLLAKSVNPDDEEKVNFFKVFALIGSMIAYVASLSFFDYRIGTFLFIIVVMVLLGVKNYRVLFLVSSISTASIFLLFEVLLKVPLS